VNQELVEYVIREVGRHRSPNDIVKHVAVQGGMNWQEAQRFVMRVLLEHRQEVVSSRKSTYRLVAVILLVIGLASSIAGAYGALYGVARGLPEFISLLILGVFMIAGGLAWLARDLRRPK
jgi:Na+/glutamate symporter